MRKKRVAVLGATGSIGKSALDVLSRAPDDFEIVLASAMQSKAALEAIGGVYPRAARVLTADSGELCAAIREARPDITVNGIAGAAGLVPSIAALETGSALALANKETIVMAGHLAARAAREHNAAIIPVDSEHSAVFHLAAAHGTDSLDEILLTASGGPFRTLSYAEMERVTPAQALAHPTWNMGQKISIDSATMANKGLEVIEAARLFNLPPEKIKVVVHPQSVVHSMIRMKDGAVYASLSKPDMRLPIAQALYWPAPARGELDRLDFDSLTLEFTQPDTERFPMLALAYRAIAQGGAFPCAYNAANEIAVAAFLAGRIGFLDIARVTSAVLDLDWGIEAAELPAVLEADQKARQAAQSVCEKLS